MMKRRSVAIVLCFALCSCAWIISPADAKTRTPPVAAVNADADLLYYYFEADPYSAGAIYGEFKNHSDHTISSPRIGFTFFDADGNVLGTAYAIPVFPTMQAGRQMPFFGILSRNGPALNTWDHLETRFCAGFDSDITQYSADGLALKNVKEEIKTPTSVLVNGIVANDRDTEAENAAVAIFFYKKDGRFAGSSVDYLSVPIPAGKSEKFTLDVGVNTFMSSEPIKHAGSGFTYKVYLSSGVGVSMGC